LNGLCYALIVTLVYCFSATTACAQGNSKCESITSDAERLQCYDAQQEQTVKQPESMVEERMNQELETGYDEFVITPHKPNYILPVTYNAALDTDNYPSGAYDGDLQKVEVKFQLSLKVPLVKHFVIKNSNLWFAYSQLSFWQLYNRAISSPFRETNYEPELLWAFHTDYKIFGLRNSLITLSLNHQSNGQSDPMSRSWNRIIANFIFDKGNYVFSFRPWYVIPRSSEDDDNPDITDYMGHGELGALYKYKKHQVTVMLRNILDFENHYGTVELNYSFRINDRLKGVAQYFYGYGESLIDYNHLSNRIGIGILLTDWL